MCTLILLRDRVPGLPLVLLMNRDEEYGRPAEEPTLTREPLSVVAPRDLRAGGTWIGVNEVGLVAALSNRRAGEHDPARRSRGLLCLEALELASALEVKDWLEEEVLEEPYNPFNLLYADRGHAFVTHCETEPRTVELADGLHFLANGDADDPDEPRIARSQALLADADMGTAEAVVAHLPRLAADHQVHEGEAICRHGDRAGTVSSTLIGISTEFPWGSLFLYSPERPCQGAFRDYSALLEGFVH